MTMFWFSGSINEAINKSKDEKKVFVVFINGSDEISQKMEDLYESLAAKLSELPLVAIKLESQSDNCKLFSQIYPVILIPSTYFIDYNGVAIEIIGGSVEDKDVLFDKIIKTIEVYKQSLPTNASENVNELTNTGNSTNTATNEVINATSSGNQSVPENDSTPETTNNSQTPGVEEKVKRANQLIEAIREKKAKEEAERERTEEIERRKGMKEMQNSKRMREEKETLDIINEREREKREEKLARERVLAQIAADREERKKRKIDLTDKKSDETIVDKREDTQEVRQRVISDKTRIQFRLPDGSTANSIFESKDRLETVREYVSSQFNLRSFILSTTFPRKEFAAEEYCKTLEELSLCPSSVLLVISKTGSNISGAITSPTFFWQIVTYLSLPFVMIWNLMTSFFSGSNRMNSNENNESQEENDRRKRDPKAFYNKDGNIARMRDGMADNDDDDNNTYNGNSTQQM